MHLVWMKTFVWAPAIILFSQRHIFPLLRTRVALPERHCVALELANAASWKAARCAQALWLQERNSTRRAGALACFLRCYKVIHLVAVFVVKLSRMRSTSAWHAKGVKASALSMSIWLPIKPNF